MKRLLAFLALLLLAPASYAQSNDSLGEAVVHRQTVRIQ